jgi:hypothetical protein
MLIVWGSGRMGGMFPAGELGCAGREECFPHLPPLERSDDEDQRCAGVLYVLTPWHMRHAQDLIAAANSEDR